MGGVGITPIFVNFITVFEFNNFEFFGGGVGWGGRGWTPLPCRSMHDTIKIKNKLCIQIYIPVIEIHVLKKSSLCMIDMSYSLYLLVKENWCVKIPKNTSSYWMTPRYSRTVLRNKVIQFSVIMYINCTCKNSCFW